MSYFEFEGKDIYYEVYGTGRPFLVLNGIMMSCSSWQAFIPNFSACNQLILVDFLDQGKSSKMEGHYTQEIQVELLHALMSHLKLEKTTVLGISYGSEVALQFALKYPNHVDRLMLFNATARTGSWLRDIGDSWNKAAGMGDGEAYYLASIPVIYSPKFYTTHSEWMRRRRELLTPVFANPAFYQSMVRLTNSAASYDVADRIHEITAPTLVVSCQQDYLTPVEEQQLIAARIPNSHYAILPDCGHASMYEQPTLFAALALGFLNQETAEYHIL